MEDIKNYTVLAVDDAQDSLLLIEFDLADAGYTVLTANSGHEALTILKEQSVHLILLDMHMPGISGLTTLQEIKAQINLAHIPIIMLSASDDGELIVSALEHGADDYVTKPYISKVLLARMRTSLRLMEKTMELEKLAKTDFLTKLNNRGSFDELVCKALSQANRSEQSVSIAMFDLDLFKQVNDTYGHEAGDKALVEFASILTKTFRDYDIVGRIGGEEFAVCMPNSDIQAAFNACERCRKSLESHVIPIEYEGKAHQLSLTVSIGITCDVGPLLSFEEMLRKADQGLYKAKGNGRNKTVIEQDITEEKIGDSLERFEDERSQNPELNQEYPGIDFNVGVNNVLGDKDLFDEILVMFYQDHGKDHLNIEKAIAEQDQKQMKHLVHTLKGVSCSIGAMNLFEYCKKLDTAINEEKPEEIPSLFPPVNEELVKVINGIEAKLSDKL